MTKNMEYEVFFFFFFSLFFFMHHAALCTLSRVLELHGTSAGSTGYCRSVIGNVPPGTIHKNIIFINVSLGSLHSFVFV